MEIHCGSELARDGVLTAPDQNLNNSTQPCFDWFYFNAFSHLKPYLDSDLPGGERESNDGPVLSPGTLMPRR